MTTAGIRRAAPVGPARGIYVYVDTATGSEEHRNKVMRADQFRPPTGTRGAWMTYLRYTDGLVEHWRTHRNARGNPTVKKYRGPALATLLPFDIDREDRAHALADARLLFRWLTERWEVPGEAIHIVFSGKKGF